MRTGDVVCVRSTGPFAGLIRFGAWLRGLPHQCDHVAIVTDDSGNLVQAMPSGVTVGNIGDYPSQWTITNEHQPKTDQQRQEIAALAKSFERTPYDWAAIAEDAGNVFDWNDPLVQDWTPDTVPATFVCSSLAAYVYSKTGLDCPPGRRFVTPADWSVFIQVHDYS